MDIQAEKIELAKLILSTDDQSLISKIKALFTEADERWWEELPDTIKKEIRESVKQADNGEVIPFSDIKDEINSLFEK